ncbi:MAG: hypothetical protein WHS44_02605 [Fimbriimonadales bacterium]|nr:MAG: hypothetical protein KatS3mg018_2016 [Fimbriimonadales bacterium]
MRTALVCLMLAISMLSGAAQRVYLFRTGDAVRDAALYDALRAHGLQVTLGALYREFDGAHSLNAYQVAVLIGAGNTDDMPLTGQDALLAWVGAGGGLVTLEWTLWSVASVNRLLILRELFPAVHQRYTYRMEVQYQQQVSDPVLNQGLGAALTLGEGHEAHLSARPGATVYYASDYFAGAGGVVGWAYQQGRVMSLSVAPAHSLNPMAQNTVFRRLLTNAVRWAAQNACAPAGGDADRNGCVDDADLLQVLFAFGATGDPSADVNCDGIVDDADLLEALFAFGSGC